MVQPYNTDRYILWFCFQTNLKKRRRKKILSTHRTSIHLKGWGGELNRNKFKKKKKKKKRLCPIAFLQIFVTSYLSILGLQDFFIDHSIYVVYPVVVFFP